MDHCDEIDARSGRQRVGLSSDSGPWRWTAATLLRGFAVFIWIVAGPLRVRHGDYMLPSEASWEGAFVLDARFWFTTGTVDYVQRLVVQRPDWLVIGLWTLHLVLVPAVRRLGVRHWLAGFVVAPILLGQLIVVFLYCSGLS